LAPQQELAQYAIKSYRYLRLAIVVVVLSLLASVIIERLKTSCWEVSISAYYYTPVHAMFVGALVAIGVCLIAVKGSEEWEDMLLNVAGILAPIVAFVPTSPPSRSCASSPFGAVDAEAYLDNNVLAFAIGGVVAIGGTWLIARLQHRDELAAPAPETKYGLLLCLALATAGVIWYAGFRQSFLDHAHAGTAIAMFVMVGIVMAINARHAKKSYRGLYAVLAGCMAAAFVGVFVVNLILDDWRHAVLWLEILELIPFAVFWAAQTFELWDGGVRNGEA
jgi:cytochrome bd-type quinol oxidase subunit 2